MTPSNLSLHPGEDSKAATHRAAMEEETWATLASSIGRPYLSRALNYNAEKGWDNGIRASGAPPEIDMRFT